MQTFTENGLVKIRFSKGKGANTFTIRTLAALEAHVAQHEAETENKSHQTAPAHNDTNNTHTQQNQPTPNDQQDASSSNKNNEQPMEHTTQ